MKDILEENKEKIQTLKIEQLDKDIYDWKWAMKNMHKNPALYIVSLYWKAKYYTFDNKLEAEGQLVRDIRIANKYLEKYPLKKYKDMLGWLVSQSVDGEFFWTLETIDKKLPEYNLALRKLKKL